MMKKKNYLFIIQDGILGKRSYFSFGSHFLIYFHLFSHDEWIKLDRVIERKDSTNANTLFQQRPRRTSQINTLRHQHLDSTNSSNSNELNNQQSITNSLLADLTSSSTLINDDDEQHKIHKTNKIEESDIDDNSQGQSESNYSFVVVFSLLKMFCYRS